jgi:hypothetical protein
MSVAQQVTEAKDVVFPIQQLKVQQAIVVPDGIPATALPVPCAAAAVVEDLPLFDVDSLPQPPNTPCDSPMLTDESCGYYSSQLVDLGSTDEIGTNETSFNNASCSEIPRRPL